MRRPIKHILDDTVVDEAGAAVRSINLVHGVTGADPYGANQSDVNAGAAIVKSIDLMLEFWIDNKTTASTLTYDRLDWDIFYNIASQQTTPDPRVAGQSDIKNQIMHMDQATFGCSTVAATGQGTATKAFITWHLRFNVPKWAQKINKDDVIVLNYVWADSAATHCVKLKAIFMEYEQS